MDIVSRVFPGASILFSVEIRVRGIKTGSAPSKISIYHFAKGVKSSVHTTFEFYLEIMDEDTRGWNL